MKSTPSDRRPFFAYFWWFRDASRIVLKLLKKPDVHPLRKEFPFFHNNVTPSDDRESNRQF